MKRIEVIGVCLTIVVAFAWAIVVSASAAEPALYECAKAAKVGKKYTGKYTDKKCSKEATAKEIEEGKTNKYELKEGFGKGKLFKGKGKGVDLEEAEIGGITCMSSTDTGKFTSPKTAVNIVVTFKGCSFAGKKCTSEGAQAGELVTNPLKGEIGYLAGKGTETPKVGIDLSAESGEVLAVGYNCFFGAAVMAVTGSVIGEVTPVNVFTKEWTWTFRQTREIGVQEWTKFEEGPKDILRTHVCDETGCNPLKHGSGAQTALETTVANKGEELELKA
jgi:hypothetical protein